MSLCSQGSKSCPSDVHCPCHQAQILRTQHSSLSHFSRPERRLSFAHSLLTGSLGCWCPEGVARPPWTYANAQDCTQGHLCPYSRVRYHPNADNGLKGQLMQTSRCMPPVPLPRLQTQQPTATAPVSTNTAHVLPGALPALGWGGPKGLWQS